MRSLIVAALLMLPTPALAQSEIILDGQRLVIDGREIVPLQKLRAKIPAESGSPDAVIAIARQAVRSRDGGYVRALYTLEIAKARGDDVLRIATLDELIAQGVAPPRRMIGYLRTRSDAAFAKREFGMARDLWRRALLLSPGDGDILNNLAQAALGAGDDAAALDYLDEATTAYRAAGRPVPEVWQRQRLAIASRRRDPVQALAIGRATIAAQPTRRNWRDALVVYRQSADGDADADAEIDLLRLMRAAGLFDRADEYLRLAGVLANQRLIGEAQAVVAEGRSRGVLRDDDTAARSVTEAIEGIASGARTLRAESAPAAFPEADAALGAGRFDAAATLYARAAEAGGVRPALALRRQGIALLRAGRTGEGIAVLAMLPGDAVAQFWTLWARTPPGR